MWRYRNLEAADNATKQIERGGHMSVSVRVHTNDDSGHALRHVDGLILVLFYRVEALAQGRTDSTEMSRRGSLL
jgi:hypothetical protein